MEYPPDRVDQLAPGSFDSRRELAIVVHDNAVRLEQVVHHDWSHSVSLDLSDEGLLADLAEIEEEAAAELALENHHKNHHHQ